jgi:YidC/Oxa1 family membrane protein insertase
MIDFFNAILRPLELAVAWIMVAWHRVLTAVGLPEDSGWTWALSIVGLVIVIRILLIPLFVKQIKASRGLQLIQPEMKKIQAKYKGKTDQASRQAMTQETMELYKRTGTNPFASCLPILLQSPIFFALFRVLNGIPSRQPIGALDQELVQQADEATLFGAPLSDTFLGANTTSTQILTVILIILMSASTFTTQRQLMMKNMPAAALDNPFAQQQKILLYVLPVIFAVSGVNFPIGVLIYWLTTNLWSMGQQFYVIRRMPAPGSPAERALEERRRRRGSGPSDGGETEPTLAGEDGASGAEGAGSAAPVSGQRQQPKRQPKSKRSTAASRGPKPPRPGGSPGPKAAAATEGPPVTGTGDERPSKGR